MKSCVFPGSFDPVTIGHTELIRRASALFDRVTVTVMVNINKKGCIPVDTRVELLRKALKNLPNVRVDRWNGLLADYMKEKGETCILRGVRNASEFDAENTAAAINRRLNPEVCTLLMPADDEMACVSSSAVRELAAFGGDPRPFLPKETAEEIMKALSNNI